MSIDQWSTTAASNASGVTGVNWAEGQAPSTVNDSARALMADVAAWYGQAKSGQYITGTAGTNTITATGPASMAAYAAGQLFLLIPANTNTGATTLNITPSGGAALGAKNIFASNAALSGGELRINVPVAIMYDGTQFQVVGPISKVPTIQSFTSGSGTYTTPAGATRIFVRMLGAGGGGAGSGSAPGNGGNGGNTTFSTLTAAGGTGATTTAGGAGGAGTNGDLNITGGTGGTVANSNNTQGGVGGSGPLGGFGAGGAQVGGAGLAAITNTGSGGGGGGQAATASGGGGGGAGAYVEKTITAPAATYSYGVGAAGSAGAAGSTAAGGAGGSGLIIVQEFYN